MKKLLLLGGSTQQIPAIDYAAKQGYYTVLCDYLPDNPGQRYARKYYCASTTDKQAVLEIAQKEKVNGIVAYASDPAAPTAAFVAEKLGLPTNPYKSVEILAIKDLFRKFLKENNFTCPQSGSCNNIEQAKAGIETFIFPIMIKPVDSSGSKGIRCINSPDELEEAFEYAMSISRMKNVIIEEYIERAHEYMIGGDCFVLNGKVEFWGLLNCHRNTKVNPLIPVGKSYPLLIDEERLPEIYRTVQKTVELLNIQFGGFNLELMFDKTGKLYFIEMGPRNGGNMIPELLQKITGVNLIGAAVESALGNTSIDLQYTYPSSAFYATHVLHTIQNGNFQRIEYHSKLKRYIIEKVIYKKTGDPVRYFDGADKAIGILFMKFNSMDEMLDIVDSMNILVNIVVD